MSDDVVDNLVMDWDEVYKKGQLSLWILLAIFEGKKYAAQINEFMMAATDGRFEVKEQSLYRALRRFSDMGLVEITEEQSPNSGPKRKYYELSATGRAVLGRFIELNVFPLFNPTITSLLQRTQQKGTK